MPMGSEICHGLWTSRVSPDDVEPFESVVDSMRLQDGKVQVWAYVEERMEGWSWI